MTRFPPEPNGYLHIGHAKSICLNFGIAAERAGRGLQPSLRRHQPVDGGRRVRPRHPGRRAMAWLRLGYRLYFASDYFQQLYDLALRLVAAGKAYVDSQSVEEMREGRGSFYKPGHVEPVPRPVGGGEPRSLRSACAPASSPTERTCSARRSTWNRPTRTCATRSCTACGASATTARATRGASIRCTTLRTATPTRSRA